MKRRRKPLPPHPTEWPEEGMPIPRRRRSDKDFITRGDLAQLRDEIEIVLEDARKACERTSKVRQHAIDWDRKQYSSTVALTTRVENMEAVLGLDMTQPHLRVLSEPVTWSYFHVWIQRINERLDKIEQTMGGHDGRTATGIDRTDRDAGRTDQRRKGQAGRKPGNDPGA